MSKRHELRRKELMEITLEQAIDYYLGNLQLEHKSPATILWHRKKLTGFKRFMLNQRPSVKISELDLQDGRAFVQSLQERTTKYSGHKFRQEVMEGLAPQTISSYVRSMGSILNSV